MAMQDNGVRVYDDGKGGKWVKDTSSDTRIHINDKGHAAVFDSKKQKNK